MQITLEPSSCMILKCTHVGLFLKIWTSQKLPACLVYGMLKIVLSLVPNLDGICKELEVKMKAERKCYAEFGTTCCSYSSNESFIPLCGLADEALCVIPSVWFTVGDQTSQEKS